MGLFDVRSALVILIYSLSRLINLVQDIGQEWPKIYLITITLKALAERPVLFVWQSNYCYIVTAHWS